MAVILRRLGTAPAQRPGCTETGNCPDVFETDNGFALIGEYVTDANGLTTVVVPRKVLLAAARQMREEGLL